MDTEERKTRLKTLVGHFLTKYDLSHHSCSHICFNIKPEDVKYIVDNYSDVLLDSNLYISPSSHGHCSYRLTKFEVYSTELYFGVTYDGVDGFRFETSVRMNDCSRIQIDVSCETIFTLEFFYEDMPRYDQVSFRNDNKEVVK